MHAQLNKLALMASVAVISMPAFAQDTIQLDKLVVSGGMAPILSESYGRAHTVITSEELEQRGITTIQDALRTVPGVSVNGSGDSYTQIRIRGSEANHTLMLIDGVPVKAGDGEYILTGLGTAGVSRIEVLRGPQSVLYGADASAGVINILTDRGRMGTELKGNVEVGNGYTASAHGSHRVEQGGLSVNVSKSHDRGHDQSGDGGEADAIDRASVYVTGDWALTEQLKAGFSVRHSREHYDYDNTNSRARTAAEYVVDADNKYSVRREFGGEAWLALDSFDGRLSQRLSYFKSMFSQSYDGAATTRAESDQIGYRATVGLDGSVKDGKHRLSIAADRRVDSNDSAPEYERRRHSLAAEYQGTYFDALDLQAGVRHDWNNRFENAWSWSVGASWRVQNTPLRLHASAGEGIVNPSYLELYGNPAWGMAGNPDLMAERNRGFDIGAELTLWQDRATIDVTWFKEAITDEITYAYGAGPGGQSIYVNQSGRSPRHGFEVSSLVQPLDNLDFRLAYTWLMARDPDRTVEVRRPRHEGTLAVTWRPLDSTTLTTDIRHVAGNYDSRYFGTPGKAKMPSYTVVNLIGRYALTDNIDLTARAVNLFDKQYEDVWGYAKRGRTVYFGISARL